MQRGRRQNRDTRPYQQVIQEAARLLAQGEAGSLDEARRKAVARLGVSLRHLPDNTEIEQALKQYQSLFHSDGHLARLWQLRQAALNAMRLLEQFEPRLVGPVLSGSAPPHSAVHLHLFADTPETVALFLLEKRIPCEYGERRVRYTVEQWETMPLYRFVAGDVTLELTIFPTDGLRRRPLSPVDNRPMQRSDIGAVERLLAST